MARPRLVCACHVEAPPEILPWRAQRAIICVGTRCATPERTSRFATQIRRDPATTPAVHDKHAGPQKWCCGAAGRACTPFAACSETVCGAQLWRAASNAECSCASFEACSRRGSPQTIVPPRSARSSLNQMACSRLRAVQAEAARAAAARPALSGPRRACPALLMRPAVAQANDFWTRVRSM